MANKPRKISEKNDKQFQRLDALIARRFIASNMSDAKWVKLLKAAALFAEKVPYLNVKLVYDYQVKYTFTEDTPEQVEEFFFSEPTFYKELEWIEFPYVRKITNANGVSINFQQDLTGLKTHLENLANFPLEETETGLRVRGYIAKT